MIKYDYLHFVCEQEELQNILALRGAEGWRLHTCEPMIKVGRLGTGLMSVFVVMDQAFQEDTQEEAIPEAALEGIRMKG